MAFLLQTFWAPVALAALLGVVIGWGTCRHAPSHWWSSWVPLAIIAGIGGVYAAVSHLLPGRGGLGLEIGLMMLAAYLAGCCIACFINGLMFGPPRAAERDPNADLVARKLAGIDSIAAERRAREQEATVPAVAAVAAAGAAVSTAAAPPATATIVAAAVAGGAVQATAATAGRGIAPPLLAKPRGGSKDDLTLIWGVAEKLAERMNRMGIWHFDQIAGWTPDHVKWFEAQVEGFRGRIERDKWIEQCGKLAKGWKPETSVGTRPKG